MTDDWLDFIIACRSGQPHDYDIVIGTHALISEAVTFHNLALAVIDEQHRFGVEQRLRLRSCEGDEQYTPHLLMLSATPIPRTLAMSYLADMDVSVIDELPPGRTPIQTKLVSLGREFGPFGRIDACRVA